MSIDIGETPLDDEEWLARFVLQKSHIRADGTIKPDPFIPYRHTELSVTRHLSVAESAIWNFGEIVASQTDRSLRGRADIRVAEFARLGLRTIADPLPENPNHANVTGWPGDKQAQKEMALEIAEKAVFKANPETK